LSVLTLTLMGTGVEITYVAEAEALYLLTEVLLTLKLML